MIREFTNEQEWLAAVQAAGRYVHRPPAGPPDPDATPAEQLLEAAYRGSAATVSPLCVYPLTDMVGGWNPAVPPIDLDPGSPAGGILADTPEEFEAWMYDV
jgi:hypothetical protein